LECYFEHFLALFFPQIHQDIDWAQGYEFLDKELQKIVRDAQLGRRMVDKLVKVKRKDGAEIWVLIHIEVQGQVDEEFSKRMYVYHYRVFDRYNLPVVSLAVLADESTEWRVSGYEYALWGCRLRLDFPMVKLLDYREQWEALQASLNPFAVLVMAYLKARETHGDATGRLQWKLSLVKALYKQGFARRDILEIYRFIDWMMVLPEALAEKFDEEIFTYEEALRMRYITSTERSGIRKGMEKGMEKGIEKGMEKGIEKGEAKIIKRLLSLRFGALPEAVSQRLDAANSVDLEVWAERVLDAETLPEVFH
jgi:hypothetical protein